MRRRISSNRCSKNDPARAPRDTFVDLEGASLPVYRPRTRLVNFRLSEDEFLKLKDTCARSGARSVSDYARSAVLSGNPMATLPPESISFPLLAANSTDLWERLESKVNQLEAKMSFLVERESIATHG